ncbi:hypothetical protein K144313037_19650 [Clostridium tetani]|uniref:DUF2935 domain-containing protein n=1 Tax=Clostridium tetani TaxID=1513 RepID=A0ABC8EE43_CLOTA|nr:DUF2935 domain-containing protein [Clostridium tetani]AVP54028.1 DUF2935 domain-containing protein [Clostridium tetani]KGI39312.1 hypothetical protein LA33_00950 [Clostridium tetani ATCC 9441]RXI53733.1 DUF2935 domain-containing protein [Clostridium tetani]RXI54663.1 DUF2935 domain-containing protein [Clostridium tetani]RXI77149.1 DUF2935 domain-containing protein [Clostridium tetani]
MLSRTNFIRQSLELHLFFARIMKEHSFFLELGFTPKNRDFTLKADALRMEFDKLLAETISLSNCVVRPDVLESGEVVTPFTLKAEIASSYFTGVNIPTSLTKAEERLRGSCSPICNPILEQRVCMLNEKAIKLIKDLIRFKTTILSEVLCCRMFTVNYPLLIDHILREAKLYLMLVQMLQSRKVMNLQRYAYEQETFWNRIMAEHAKFIRGLLDPTEDALIDTANNFGKEFDELTKEAKRAMDKTMPISKVTNRSLRATRRIRDFKKQGTEGILDCKIRSIIIPLLADHTLREANHFLRLLKIFKKSECVRSDD